MAVRPRTSAGPIDARAFKDRFDEATANIETVIKGKTDVVRLAMIAILCEGHILFEDLPGTGKSMLARAISETISASSARIQCTPDMLPGDITGSSIYNAKAGTFDFQPGPVFTNILLADEINRATPKTQSALLEAMALGVPVVSTDVTGIPELVEDGRTHIVLDLAQAGVGTAACGPGPLPGYRLPARPVTGSLLFRPAAISTTTDHAKEPA